MGGMDFVACPQRPKSAVGRVGWAFVILPSGVSASLPRRGRVTVAVRINGYAFNARLEPDGQKSHWLRMEDAVLKAAGVSIGESVRFEIAQLDEEPEPAVPDDLARALASDADACRTWEATTVLARVDWIHWLESARQAKTRAKRVADACEMLGQGKKRVCCFDPSGFYSKAFRAPEVG